MKVTVAILLVVCTLQIEASLIPLLPAAVSYTAVSSPTKITVAGPEGLKVISGVPPSVPFVVVPSAPGPVVVAPPVALVPAQGTYVAQTRGAVHIAPLEGHANSATSVNLEPAPGTES